MKERPDLPLILNAPPFLANHARVKLLFRLFGRFFGLRYKLIILLTPLLIASAACALMADTGVKDTRPILENTRPSVIWLAPPPNSRFAAGAEILLLAQARDLGEGVVRIEFYDTFDTLIDTLEADGENGVSFLQGAIRWRPTEIQRHFVKVRAFRADGTSSAQPEISIEIINAGDVPLPRPTVETPPPAPVSDGPIVTEEAEVIPEAPIEAANTPEPAAVAVQARVLVEALNVRVAPRIDAAAAAPALTANAVITLVGHSTDGEWYAMQLPSGSVAWVFARSLEITQGDAATLPLVATP